MSCLLFVSCPFFFLFLFFTFAVALVCLGFSLFSSFPLSLICLLFRLFPFLLPLRFLFLFFYFLLFYICSYYYPRVPACARPRSRALPCALAAPHPLIMQGACAKPRACPGVWDRTLTQCARQRTTAPACLLQIYSRLGSNPRSMAHKTIALTTELPEPRTKKSLVCLKGS